MKYLINETLCEKVEVEGFEYYVTGDDFHSKNLQNNDTAYHWGAKELVVVLEYKNQTGDWLCSDGYNRDSYKLRKVIATNNSSLDLPQVVDELEGLAENHARSMWGIYYDDIDTYCDETRGSYAISDYKAGYLKAKETFEYTKEDMVEFTEWLTKFGHFVNGTNNPFIELLDIWNEQRIIKLNIK